MAHLHPIHDEESYTRMTSLMKFLLDAACDDEEHPLSGMFGLVGDLYI